MRDPARTAVWSLRELLTINLLHARFDDRSNSILLDDLSQHEYMMTSGESDGTGSSSMT